MNAENLPFELSSEGVSTWLENLAPNTNERCQRIFTALSAVNARAIPPKLRWEILEALRPAVFFHSQYLVSSFVNAAFPLAPKAGKLAKLCIQFHAEMTKGYQHICRDPDFAKLFGRIERATLIHRALQSLSLVVLRNVQQYTPLSARRWDSLKTLYRQAEKLELLDLPVAEDQQAFAATTTVQAVFKRICIFWLSNPYRFAQHEIETIFFFLEKYHGHIRIHDNATRDHENASHFLDLYTKLPPQPISQKPASGHYRYLFTRALCGELWKQLEQQSGTRDKTTLPLNLTHESIQKLIGYLGEAEKKPPHEPARTYQLIVGFENILTFLARASSQKKSPTIKNQWLNIPNFDLLPLSEDGPASSNRLPHQRANSQGNSQSQVSAEDIWQDIKVSSSVNLARHSCKVCDSGVDGYRVIIVENADIKVGQIIALILGEDPLKIGVTRWRATASAPGHYCYGVELLTHSASLATLKFDASRKPEKALYFEDAWLSSSAGILMQPGKYKPGTPLALNAKNKEIDLQLQRLTEATPFYYQYAVIPFQN